MFRLINFLRISGVLSIFLTILSCTSRTADTNQSWQKSGSILIARSAPDVKRPSFDSALGFLPTHAALNSTWLAVDTAKKTLNLMNGETLLSTSSAVGVENIKPGSYEIVHKQRAPLWYAPDSYFTKRSLAVPGEGDRERYRRGALGDFVIFINKDTPIHSGPIWLDEIGGVKIQEPELARIYYSIEVGSEVVVK